MQHAQDATAEQRDRLDELTALLPRGAVVTDPDVIEAFRRDQARSVPAGHPLAVVRAATRVDVQTVARWSDRHDVPVVPRGAGSGLSGGANALEEILTAALQLGGTLTGEHGIGLLKQHRLDDELGSVGRQVQRAIKSALDPKGLLNPSKAI